MLRNSNYMYGSKDLVLPARIHLGEFMLDRMWSVKEKTLYINGSTNESITYGQTAQQAMNFSVSLTHMGVRKGDVVAICSENRFEFWGVIIGGACAGAVLTTVNPGYTEGEIKHVMSISKPKYVVLSPYTYKLHGKTFKSLPYIKTIIIFGEHKPSNALLYNDLAVSNNNGSGNVIVNNYLARNVKYEEFEAVDVDGQTDTLFILYSSGTTGLPKGVMLTHLNVLSSCCAPTNLSTDLLSLTIAPWFHTMGLNGALLGMAYSRTAVHLPKFDVDLFLRTIEKYKIAQVTVVPPVVVAVCKAPGQYDLSSVKIIYSGAAPLHKETEELLKTKFPNIEAVMQGYGMTETTLAVTRDTYNQALPTKPGSVGRVAAGVTIKIVDIDSRIPLGPNQSGEICVKGSLVMKGYVGKDRDSDFDSEGFFKTGDVGYYDEDGCFFIVDRLKELIKYKAFQVAPAEIEALLIEHPAVRDAAVVGVPDKAAGEVPLAFVVKQAGQAVTEKEIQQFVAERLSNPKHLRGGVRFVDAIPKNPSGKILRKELRKMVNSKKSKL
ncbi:hypothetical protein ABMA27_010999 [Loxostege sticticalis]|uniref:Luciferin 4-monooxygenase n=1 Tax=Loxostege sticticalis TaxID=481309 RepID=A0ABR3H2Z2_LOXSC